MLERSKKTWWPIPRWNRYLEEVEEDEEEVEEEAEPRQGPTWAKPNQPEEVPHDIAEQRSQRFVASWWQIGAQIHLNHHSTEICRFHQSARKAKKKKRKDCIFWHRFNEKPSVIPGCSGMSECNIM